jgi:hypothetical protein
MAEFYRVERMNANQGSMTIATVLFSNVLNMQYGLVFVADSGVNEGGETVCMVELSLAPLGGNLMTCLSQGIVHCPRPK